jgi:hypothetical protein
MASTGAVLYLRPRLGATVSPGRRTGAALYIPVRLLAGLFTSSGVDASRDTDSLRAFLPNANVPVLQANGTFNTSWYRFFQRFVDVFLGGAGALTIADIITAVTTSQEQAAQLSAIVTAVSQQTQANAESLSAVVEVAQNNSLTGAEQIPPVQRTNENIP